MRHLCRIGTNDQTEMPHYFGSNPFMNGASKGIDRNREDRRRVLLSRDLDKCLEISQLQRGRITADDVGRFSFHFLFRRVVHFTAAHRDWVCGSNVGSWCHGGHMGH